MIFGEIDLVKLMEALSKILWPLIFVYLLFSFKSTIKSLIESATSRKFTLKVAGNELTMDEVTEQQRIIISDMQSEIGDLRKVVDALSSRDDTPLIIDESHRAESQRISRVLWVDDQPQNNAFLIANLESMGVTVKTAESTKSALNMYRNGRYDSVISDMGRPEGDRAGIELAREIRMMDNEIPIHIYCGGWAAKNLRDEAIEAGVNSITSSGTVLLSSLDIGVHS
ncbi:MULTISPECIES: response regulator [Vibrio]|uniref:response regulator n=1 Tax=Vibrio TaxID=662 RepID=UPI0006A792C5|nr:MULTISPECIES: response regulator [Vibrio]EIO9265697.1 response regulator [Vibrio alginolyticus]EJI1386058.1 response regulator [Vibrio alginolyticus]ELB2876460.1 response regulator [Vibrio alginolyticus]ELB2948430.1 response regulator [Vibrio alginolyticus]PNP21491.1 response regulator [Vibrio alginolyticus]